MAPIYQAALLTTLISVLLWGSLLRGMRGPVSTRLLVATVLFTLPMEPLSYLYFRLPLLRVVEPLHLPPVWKMLLAPLTEEPFKLLVLLLPAFRAQLKPDNFARLALAIGLGFGIGEAWLLADLLAPSPKLVGLSVLSFSGFLTERLLVCLAHAGMTCLALWGWTRGRFALGLLLAMSVHFLSNFPIYLATVFPAPALWQPVLGILYGIVCPLLAGAVLARFSLGQVELGRFFMGRARCPGCQQVYSRPLLGANLGTRRYERCPHCRQWHMTGPKDEVRDENP